MKYIKNADSITFFTSKGPRIILSSVSNFNQYLQLAVNESLEEDLRYLDGDISWESDDISIYYDVSNHTGQLLFRGKYTILNPVIILWIQSHFQQGKESAENVMNLLQKALSGNFSLSDIEQWITYNCSAGPQGTLQAWKTDEEKTPGMSILKKIYLNKYDSNCKKVFIDVKDLKSDNDTYYYKQYSREETEGINDEGSITC
jgi:hypothetical protein